MSKKVEDALSILKDINIKSYVFKEDEDMLIITDERNDTSIALYRFSSNDNPNSSFMVACQLTIRE